MIAADSSSRISRRRTTRCGCAATALDRKSTRLNSSHVESSYAVFCLKKKKSAHREQRSLMPSYASRLSGTEMDDVVAYLRTLKGPPLCADAKRRRQPHHAYSGVSFPNRIGRDAEERPASLVNALEIPAGATVAEIGSGPGYFTWRLADKGGPRGKVFVFF